ncbi:NADPH:quinone oxidoreductase family protein [Gemmatimonas groenlandica]|uniref:NADPH:quinone oxidoreductase family protein n=1 Tax=Gemmatimonas groenlandica TaxID=2732249 RepID=A0A6M4IVU6_9BACT|nr:NADPH:quinone oxidoreductase family protein [Gemmatimonas groenlandica]QJR37849.1 NADPH:quinone oxidoreductase family protein [Gemmatimonas groenlandica]
MRAVLCSAFDQPETLTVNTVADPVAAAGEVVIAVHAAGVNFPDALMVLGQYQVRPPLPFTPGGEASGVIIEVGSGVSHLHVGQRVVAFTRTGAFAERLSAPASAVTAIPEALSFDVAATLPLAFGTAMHALIDRAHLASGDTLLVLGASGGVGLAAVMIGKALGARVIAAASTDDKLALCRAHGADEVINYTTESLRDRLKALTNGVGPDVICDPVGGDFTESAFRSIAWGGRYLVVGFAGGTIPSLPLNLPLLKGASVVGVFWGAFEQREPAANAHHLARLMEWVVDGTIAPVVSARYPLEQSAAALRAMLERRVVGKVVVVPIT